MRRFYILLLKLHPAPFRRRFGDEMLGIFDECVEKRALMLDGFASLFRQWTLRHPETAFSPTAAADGVPLFYSAAPEIPSVAALGRGAFIALLAFGLFSAAMSHRWKQTSLILGSHHPSPSHLLGAHTDAKAESELPAEVKIPPSPFHLPISPYFRFLLVLQALDVDQDNIISAEEIQNAPAALWKLDKNRDGKLTAEECGLRPDPGLDLGRERLEFMRIHPVLAALDTNGNGEISADEIRNAPRSLRMLDSNGHGRLTENELRPNGAVAMASNLMLILDTNGDGKISRDESKGPRAARFRNILTRADRDAKGYVTEEDLMKELSRNR